MSSLQMYEQIEQIGKGSFGVVRKVRRLHDNQILVWKQMKYGQMNSRQKQQLVTEVNVLKSLQHPHIVRYYDRIVDKNQTTVYIIMEYCPGGDLCQLLRSVQKNKQQYLPEDVIWKIFFQLMLALNYCHEHSAQKNSKILHRDIKPANIFIDQHNNIKLGDFGLSREMGQYSQFAQTHVGTPYYMSPEQIKEVKYNEKSDIWSAGCLLYEMAALKRPFEATNSLSLAKKIDNGKFQRIPFRYSWNLQNLISQMLMVNPQKRISTQQILKVPLLSIRMQQKQLKQRYKQLKRKQQELLHREMHLISEQNSNENNSWLINKNCIQ